MMDTLKLMLVIFVLAGGIAFVSVCLWAAWGLFKQWRVR